MIIKKIFSITLFSLPLIAYSTPQQEAFCAWKLTADSVYFKQLGENLANLQSSTIQLQSIAFDPANPNQYIQQVHDLTGKIQETAAAIALLQTQRQAEEAAKVQEIFYPSPVTVSQQATPSLTGSTQNKSLQVQSTQVESTSANENWQIYWEKIKSFFTTKISP